MAKGARGGRHSGGGAAYPAPSAPTQAQVDDTTQAKAFGAGYDDFMKMTMDEKADAIRTAINQDIPDHLNKGSDFQKLIYNLGLNDKPDVVSDAQLNSMNGTELFRTVNAVYDRSTDLSFTANQIAQQTQKGSVTRVSSSGTAVYGDGIYFSNSRRDSQAYGNNYGDINKTAVMRAKLNGNANMISYSSASNGASREIASGSKLGRALSQCSHTARPSVYALANGYNVINAGGGYFNILSRNAVTFSSNIMPMK